MNDDKQRPTDEGAGETSSALTRRQALMGAGLVGLVVSGGGALAACSSDSQPNANGSASFAKAVARVPNPTRRAGNSVGSPSTMRSHWIQPRSCRPCAIESWP